MCLNDPLQNKPNTPDSHLFLRDDWELPKDEFTLGEELGRGYFATVHRGRWKNLINVAVKILKSGTDVFLFTMRGLVRILTLNQMSVCFIALLIRHHV